MPPRRPCARPSSSTPGSPIPTASLVMLLGAKGRHAEAISMRLKAIEIEPGTPYRQAQLGHVLMGARDFTAAEEAIRRAIAMAPDTAVFHSDLSHVLSRADRLEQAIL